jgi:two-component system OmpR family sensor kinase
VSGRRFGDAGGSSVRSVGAVVDVDRRRAGAAPTNVRRHRVSLFRSMRVRILAAVVVLLAASAAVSIVVLRSVLRDRLDEEITVDLSQEVEEFELLATGTDPTTGRPFGGDIRAVFDVYFEREVPDEGETLLAFIGDELYRSARAPDAVPAGGLANAIAVWLALDARTEATIETPEGHARFVALPIEATSEEPNGGLFVVANFPGFEQGEIDEAVRVQAITQFVMIVAAAAIGLALAGRVLRPLRELAETARTITATDLTRRIDVQGDDEASNIARAFNAMLERLESAFATQRAFLDDVSHELRVPLTVVRGNIEVLDLVDDEAERAEMVAVATAEIERMSGIVEDLLLIARSERPGFLALDDVDVADVTADVFKRVSALGERDWQLDASSTGTARLDRQRITQALMQLAANACQHTNPGDVIVIGSRRNDRWATFWVHDSGPGIPADEAEQVFRRHVRGQARRAGSGLGLGLSIVAVIAESHQGRARVAPTSSGARVEIELPVDLEVSASTLDA